MMTGWLSRRSRLGLLISASRQIGGRGMIRQLWDRIMILMMVLSLRIVGLQSHMPKSKTFNEWNWTCQSTSVAAIAGQMKTGLVLRIIRSGRGSATPSFLTRRSRWIVRVARLIGSRPSLLGRPQTPEQAASVTQRNSNSTTWTKIWTATSMRRSLSIPTVTFRCERKNTN